MEFIANGPNIHLGSWVLGGPESRCKIRSFRYAQSEDSNVLPGTKGKTVHGARVSIGQFEAQSPISKNFYGCLIAGRVTPLGRFVESEFYYSKVLMVSLDASCKLRSCFIRDCEIKTIDIEDCYIDGKIQILDQLAKTLIVDHPDMRASVANLNPESRVVPEEIRKLPLEHVAHKIARLLVNNDFGNTAYIAKTLTSIRGASNDTDTATTISYMHVMANNAAASYMHVMTNNAAASST